MGRIPRETIDEILQRVDGLAVLSQHMSLKKSGNSYKGLCPFHQEKTPSFTYSPDKGLWYCFGCGQGGTLIDFVIRIEHIDFLQAVRMLADRAGVRIPETPAEVKKASERERLLSLMKEATIFYQRCLRGDPAASTARSYLDNRGITAESIEQFRLGYAPKARSALYNHLLKKGFKDEEMLKAGVIRRSRTGTEVLDYLYDRIIFPICDSRGRPLGLGGRVVETGEPKYLNTPESPLFSKRYVLYGLHLARPDIIRLDNALVVEGYMDVISLRQAGFNHVVASLGTALTLSHARLLRRFASRCILAYDADAAGQAATLRGIEIFETADLAVKIMVIPKGEDPDSMIKAHGPREFEKLLLQSKSVVDYLLEITSDKYDLSVPEEKGRFVRESMGIIGKIKDLVRRDEYIRRFCQTYDLREETIRRMLSYSSATYRPGTIAKKEEEHLEKTVVKPPSPEERFLVCLLSKPELFFELEWEPTENDFTDKFQWVLYQDLIEEMKAPDFCARTFLEKRDDSVKNRFTEMLLSDQFPPPDPDIIKGLLRLMRDRGLRRKLEFHNKNLSRKNQAGEIPPDDEDFLAIQQIYRELHRLS
ncbi:MAG: DNA primase [Candidatus Eremiobacteraeota bacterium]|nr:DNA primase [Candidatus Eremiobacteraeota bacterium]